MGARREDGIALVVALLTMLLLMALGSALVLITTSETMIAANFRAASEAFYAADAALQRAVSDLSATSDWDAVLGGAARSSLTDGPPTGTRTLADGSRIDLAHIVNMANCLKTAACSDAEMSATSSERPWGANNPRWRLYASGRLADMAGTGSIASAYYVVALVADDPSENDGDPAHDGSGSDEVPNPGAGVLAVRAEAFGPRGAHRIVETTIARIEPSTAEMGDGLPELRVLSWTEIR